MFSFSALIVLMLAWCKTTAPELSFEETLKIYTEQTSTVKEILNFMNDTWSQIENKIEAKTRYNAWDSIKWELSLNTDVISDNNSRDTEAKVSIWLKSDDSEIPAGGLYVKSAKVDLNTMMKDFKLYFKLLDFSIDSNQPEYVAMISELISWFKDQRLTIEAEEFTELMRKSSDNQFDMFWYLQSKDNIEKIFDEKELTKFDGYPAWKVSFNNDEIKKLSKEIYELEQKETENLYSWNEETQEDIELFNNMIDDLEIENTEAYFVIRSSDKVDFVIKNMDIITANEKFNIKETINSKLLWKDSETIDITLSNEEEDSEIYININLLPSLTSYWVDIKVSAKENWETKNLFNIKWEIKASLSEKSLSLNPNFVFESDSISADIKIDFVSEKIKDHVFDTPKDAESLDEIIWSLMGWYDEVDDEDYVYNYDDENFEEKINLEEIGEEENNDNIEE